MEKPITRESSLQGNPYGKIWEHLSFFYLNNSLHMLGHLPADMICSEKRTGADVSWKEQIMPKIKYKKKYPSSLQRAC